MRHAGDVGLPQFEPEVDLARVWRRIKDVRDDIFATDDNRDELEKQGLTFIAGKARIDGAHNVTVGGKLISARFILIATGSHPTIPPISGIGAVDPITTDQFFDLDAPPRSISIIGAGPIGAEIAQACARLGIDVTLLEMLPQLLPRAEPALARQLELALRADGVHVSTGIKIQRVVRSGENVSIFTSGPDGDRGHVAEAVLVATGRKPNIDGLGLDTVGIATDERGIVTNKQMATTIGSIYAAGDVAGKWQFTHAAGAEAALAVRNMFFAGHSNTEQAMPSCTFTDPELAAVGLTQAEAESRFGPTHVRVWRRALTSNDRARTEARADGELIIITVRSRGAHRVVGGHMLAPAAGELITELTSAVSTRQPLSKLAKVVHVYPTIATSIELLAADAAYEKAAGYRWPVRRRRQRLAGRRVQPKKSLF